MELLMRTAAREAREAMAVTVVMVATAEANPRFKVAEVLEARLVMAVLGEMRTAT